MDNAKKRENVLKCQTVLQEINKTFFSPNGSGIPYVASMKNLCCSTLSFSNAYQVRHRTLLLMPLVLTNSESHHRNTANMCR